MSAASTEMGARLAATASLGDGRRQEPVSYLRSVGDGSEIPPTGQKPPHDGRGRRDRFNIGEFLQGLKVPAAIAIPAGIALAIAVDAIQNLPVK